MRFRDSRSIIVRRALHACFAVLFAAVLMLHTREPAMAAEDTPSASIREPEIASALEKLKADPNLATTRQTRTLRWIDDDEEEERERPSWLEWIGNLFKWIAEASRLLMWTVIAVLVGLIALYLVRVVRSFDGSRSSVESSAPTHVRDLDIRPESLPDDIGAAALMLWERGERRSALSLLYRGLLSRLVHVHKVPIRDASTEGDCLALAERHLPDDRHKYIAGLIRTWQRAVYGGEEPHDAEMRTLCEQFATALQASPPAHEAAS